MITFSDRLFRPPPEGGSLLLEVAQGCSHGKCNFCRYSTGDAPLKLVSSDVLCHNLEEISILDEPRRRMFLAGGNFLTFKTDYILALFSLVQAYLPYVTQFAMYARADDILNKTTAELISLRDAGLHTLYIGIESGNRDVLEWCNKNETPEQMIDSMNLLDSLGIQYGLSSILGLGGEQRWEEHALDTAALYSSVKPASIRVMTLTAFEGTVLDGQVKRGEFKIPSQEMILREELLLLKNTDIKDTTCLFVGNHVSNSVELVGIIPPQKDELVETLSSAIESQYGKSRNVDISRW